MLERCQTVAGSDTACTWVPAEFLNEHGVGPWMQTSCWLPAEGEHAGFAWRDVSKAVAAGLGFRPFEETVEDTLRWFDELPEEARQSIQQRAGISAEKESEVLNTWGERQTD